MSLRRRIAPALSMTALATLFAATSARADLFAYLKKPEPEFAWKVVGTKDYPQGKATYFDFTSQTWQGITWKHRLQVYEPKVVKYPNMMLLFITGGSSKSGPPGDREAASYFPIAEACQARVAVLPQVPNQPLLGDRVEDDLIGETFMNYLKTKDESWPLLFPMVKSAVKAMDAVQAWSKEEGRSVEKFVVTGASKRGWTTWLTGASDDRVAAIAPMVIPTLNMKAQTKHQLEVFGGKYSEEIADYSSRGLTEIFNTPEGVPLTKMVDPYFYLDRIKEPVLQINGTNDPYWTTDSVNLFWDDIKAPSYVCYLPNAHHGLDKSEYVGYAIHGMGALFRHVATGRPLPKLDWRFTPGPVGLEVAVRCDPPAKECQFWTASAPTQDFRKSTWQPLGVDDPEATFRVTLDRPAEGFKAAFGDLTFEIDGLEYHLSTQISILGAQTKE
jgi:PhoPQ-activated pathogenicity-related protein